MTIPRKGSRPIIVEGTTYRWMVRPRPTHAQGVGESALTFAVARENDSGSTLVVTTGAARPDNWLHLPGTTVTPELVEQAIRTARSNGWRAEQDGSAFKLNMP